LFIVVFLLSILLDFFPYLFVSRQTEDGAKAQKEDCLGCHTEDGSNAHTKNIASFRPKYSLQAFCDCPKLVWALQVILIIFLIALC
jgi:hypothetical protein